MHLRHGGVPAAVVRGGGECSGGATLNLVAPGLEQPEAQLDDVVVDGSLAVESWVHSLDGLGAEELKDVLSPED